MPEFDGQGEGFAGQSATFLDLAKLDKGSSKVCHSGIACQLGPVEGADAKPGSGLIVIPVLVALSRLKVGATVRL